MARFEYLLKGYTEDRLTAGELEEFLELAEQFESFMKEKMLQDLDSNIFAGETSPEQRERMYNMVQRKIQRDLSALNRQDQAGEMKESAVIHRIPVWKKLIAAASIILILGISTYFLFFNQPAKQQQDLVNVLPADVKAPETNRAMITLADGRTVYLDSAANGTLASQSGVSVTKTADGQIIYDAVSLSLSKTKPSTLNPQLSYNTLTNPRGSRIIDMQLSDGSRVWLNAGSSVTYPVAFMGNERKINITGEAYFEIAHDKTKPFIVSANNKADVTVLGTHFNVNAYDDESEIKVTLLEGSVKVSNQKDSKLIKPGEQVTAIDHSPLTINHSPDLEQVMAWKNGQFIFNGSDIKSIMREAARWYDLDVEYKGTINKTFKGKVPRTVNISELFQIMEATGWVHFKIEGKKVVVTP